MSRLRIWRPPNPGPDDVRFAVERGVGEIEFDDHGACWFEPQVPEGWVEMVLGKAPLPPRLMRNEGVHAAHCCPKCGCRYGAEDCAVASGTVQPEYPPDNGCENCAFERGEDEG